MQKEVQKTGGGKNIRADQILRNCTPPPTIDLISWISGNFFLCQLFNP
jgi:hypothetical protein